MALVDGAVIPVELIVPAVSVAGGWVCRILPDSGLVIVPECDMRGIVVQADVGE